MITGLKLVREIKNNERFVSYEAEFKGHKVFAKKAASANTALHLKFQAKNSATVNKIGHRLFRSPEVIAADEDWLIVEWIDGPTLEAAVTTNPSEAAKAVVQVINIFDSQPDSPTPLRPVFSAQGLAQRVGERIDKDVRASSSPLFTESLELFKTVAPSLQACLQDADIQPEHLFRDPQTIAQYVLVDSEHLNTHWPRFYDLANNYSKFWKRDNRAFASRILDEYLKVSSSKPEQVFQPFVACLIVRALALHWEVDYDTNAGLYNVPRSQELLRACLAARNLSDLLY